MMVILIIIIIRRKLCLNTSRTIFGNRVLLVIIRKVNLGDLFWKCGYRMLMVIWLTGARVNVIMIGMIVPFSLNRVVRLILVAGSTNRRLVVNMRTIVRMNGRLSLLVVFMLLILTSWLMVS